MKGNIEERACRLALYIVENKATVRAAARKFGISKSTVHKDLRERLPAFHPLLYRQVKEVLDENKAQRHIRGGTPPRRRSRGPPPAPPGEEGPRGAACPGPDGARAGGFLKGM